MGRDSYTDEGTGPRGAQRQLILRDKKRQREAATESRLVGLVTGGREGYIVFHSLSFLSEVRSKTVSGEGGGRQRRSGRRWKQ